MTSLPAGYEVGREFRFLLSIDPAPYLVFDVDSVIYYINIDKKERKEDNSIFNIQIQIQIQCERRVDIVHPQLTLSS